MKERAATNELLKDDELAVVDSEEKDFQDLLDSDTKSRVHSDRNSHKQIPVIPKRGVPYTDRQYIKESDQRIEISKMIVNHWVKKENEEMTNRRNVMSKMLWLIVIQFVIAVIILILIGLSYLNFEDEGMVMISFFLALILQLLGLLVIAFKYIYNERSTKSLEIIASIMRDSGDINLKHKLAKNDSNIEQIVRDNDDQT